MQTLMRSKEVQDRINLSFSWARERETIRQRREAGVPRKEWTKDPVFQQYRLCNVDREDDKTTKWFRENVREPLRNDPKVLLATVAFRWFNKIETGEIIKDQLLGEWNSEIVRERLKDINPIVTGAYMIKSPTGMKKLDGILWCIDKFIPDYKEQARRISEHKLRLEQAWKIFPKYPYLGAFYSYEIVTDLRHTYLLENAEDIMTWANPGPGAARGASWILFGQPDLFDRVNPEHRERILQLMQYLLEKSKDDLFWNQDWKVWEMRTAEHWLCETWKIARTKFEGGRCKELFKNDEPIF